MTMNLVYVCFFMHNGLFMTDKLNLFAGKSSPMFLSTFSHAELWHLGCNMVVLWSFASPIQGIVFVIILCIKPANPEMLPFQLSENFIPYYFKLFNSIWDLIVFCC